ncbi:acyltransferase [Salmonella enterica subsp. enterica serovar Typhimurium]|uniref:DNA transfer protein n=1 Tax=Salmonella enterica TaxID=28901 RepID=UPI0007358B25|nr:DNA transfer protein [Salmonella enterica]ECX2548167.1 acyltransferase [Salmonella enterica subsp. enterica serovar Typhimurium]EDU5019929.1 acyltransferase [Salmonella enterica subsp. enterica serovar Typhimurium var. 5-]EBA8865482.1 acyltransferase [Salmonella enterica]EBT6872020.1 acyltransferase [Salmonella enterica]EDI5356969.1 acyltransferase [Salmonella enterica subsp. enterica serovar Typhimurium]
MATWQQGINSGGFLAGIGAQNENAPKASDINATLGLIRENNDLARSGANNVALTGLRGLAGVADIYKQEQQQKALNAFNQVHANAWATGDPSGLFKFAQENPAFVAQAQQAFSGLNEQQRNDMGDLAMKANVALSQGPESYSKFITDNKDRLNRVGANPDWMIQTGVQNPEQLSHMLTTMSLGALGPEKAFAVQDKMVGREIDRGRLAETIRSNQAGEALQARGQNLSYQSAMTGHNIAAQRLALDQQEFGFKMQQAQEKAQQLISEAPKLSVNMEKGIETAVNNATASSNSANSMSALAQQFRAEKPTTGLFGNAQNMFAKLTGSDTTLRDLRIRQNALVNSQVLKFLPPGPATDKDVEIVRQGAPTDMDNPETVARWLDAMANLERRNAQFNEFKAEWMSANGNPGQSRNGGQILGLDVKKGESLGSAVKRYMSMNTDAAPAQDSTPSGEPRNQVGSYTSKSGIQFTVE